MKAVHRLIQLEHFPEVHGKDEFCCRSHAKSNKVTV